MDYKTILIRTILSVVLGGLIGMERQSKHRPAGFRTHILVCLGAMTIIILSELIFIRYYTLYEISFDPTRMSAQVISGIGFLGAGTIVHYGANVKGLTTAASLWAVASIGLAVGSGFYALAIIVSIALYTTLFLFNKLSRKIGHNTNTLELYIVLENKPRTLGAINLLLARSNTKIVDMDFMNHAMDYEDSTGNDETISLRIVLKNAPSENYQEILQGLSNIKGVITAERI